MEGNQSSYNNINLLTWYTQRCETFYWLKLMCLGYTRLAHTLSNQHFYGPLLWKYLELPNEERLLRDQETHTSKNKEKGDVNLTLHIATNPFYALLSDTEQQFWGWLEKKLVVHAASQKWPWLDIAMIELLEPTHAKNLLRAKLLSVVTIGNVFWMLFDWFIGMVIITDWDSF